MKRILVHEVDLKTYEHTRYIWFGLPFVCDPGGYIAVTSFNAFFCGRKKRNWSSKYLYCEHRDEDIDHTLEHNTFSEVPNVHVNSIWDFYKLIVYDYKKNKYAG